MATEWDFVPDWARVVADWEQELGRAGVSPFGIIAAVDVVADDPADLVGMRDQPGAWLPRERVDGLRTIEIADLDALRMAHGLPGAAAQELAQHIARTGGDRELLAALMIHATALGYRLAITDTLRMLGELAAARLEVEGIRLVAQGERQTLLRRGHLPYAPHQYAHVVTALAREHADILRHLRPVRFRPLLRRDGVTRAAVAEELRGGLVEEMIRLARAPIVTVMEVEGPSVLDAQGRPVPAQTLDAANRDVQQAVAHAIADAIVEASRFPDQYLDHGDISWDPPFSAVVTGVDNEGYTVRLQAREPRPHQHAEPDAEIRVKRNGTMRDKDRAEVARMLEFADEYAELRYGSLLRMETGEEMDERVLRIDPLTRHLLASAGVDPEEDLIFPWSAPTIRPDEFEVFARKDIRHLGLAVVNHVIVARRITIACPVNGGLVFRNDGRTFTVTTPRAYDAEALDRQLARVLRTPLLDGMVGPVVDHLSVDERGRSVIYIRVRPEALA